MLVNGKACRLSMRRLQAMIDFSSLYSRVSSENDSMIRFLLFSLSTNVSFVTSAYYNIVTFLQAAIELFNMPAATPWFQMKCFKHSGSFLYKRQVGCTLF